MMSHEMPEAKVIMKREPKKKPFWRRVKNFFSRLIGQRIKKTADKTTKIIKKIGKFLELIVRVSLINPLGQFLLGFLAIYFVLWILNVMYMYIGSLAFITIIPVVMIMVGIQILVMALNEDTARKMMDQRRQRGYV